MSAVEFWRGREEPLPSRWPVIVLFASLVAVLPEPHRAGRQRCRFRSARCRCEPGWRRRPSICSCSFHALLLTVLIVALSKERLELDQRTKAQTDPLTGALNRRAFMSRGGRLLLRHAARRAPLCLLFLDLDHFKSLNDRFGHSGGDDVLMKFVGLVHANIRPTDFLFRIGGEEFCCLLPRTGTEQAHRVAERIRHQFEMTTVDVAGTPVKATVSLGIASTEAFGYDLDTLMRRADMAVYAVKRRCSACCSLVFWLNGTRGSTWFAWWSATFAVSAACTSLLFMLRGSAGRASFTIGVGSGASLIAGLRLLLAGRARVRPAAGRSGARCVRAAGCLARGLLGAGLRRATSPSASCCRQLIAARCSRCRRCRVLARPRGGAAVALAGDRAVRLASR